MPQKPIIGSIGSCGDRRWQVMWPVGRKEDGKLIYRWKTIHGTKKAALAFRDEELAKVPPEKIAPIIKLRRPRSPPRRPPFYERLVGRPLPTRYAISKAGDVVHAIQANELYRLPYKQTSDAVMLAIVRDIRLFTTSRAFFRALIGRNLWEAAAAYSLPTNHAREFLDVVKGAPYYNQTALNEQCARIVSEGIAKDIADQFDFIAEQTMRAMSVSIFQRAPDVWVPSAVWIRDVQKDGPFAEIVRRIEPPR